MPETARDPFVRWLEDSIAGQGWSFREASRRAGLADSAVSDYLAGRRRPLSPACRRLARLFGVAEDVVLSLAGHRSAPLDDNGRSALFDLLRDQPVAVLDEVERWVRPFIRAYWEDHQQDRLPRPVDLSIQLRWDTLAEVDR